jgi:hypothetical protein
MDVGEIATLLSAVGALLGTVTGLIVALKAKSEIAAIHILTNSTHQAAITRNAQLENVIADAELPLPPVEEP